MNEYNIKKNKITLCTNCGKKGHEYKQCREPITSWGIILIKISEDNDFKMNRKMNEEKIDISNYLSSVVNNGVSIVGEEKYRNIIGKCFYHINFLLISRKNSLGYIEFVRGRYKPHKIDATMYLFRQMTSKEIEKIKNTLDEENGFDILWYDLWGEDKGSNLYLSEEYINSKKQYDILKNNTGVDINLEFIVQNARPDYDIDEWGFPKGRRNKYESEKECAIREFEEESGYSRNDIVILDNIKPLEEEFTGTNGIKYRHIYYLAELVADKEPMNGVTESQKREIGNIGFFDYQTTQQIIREYHISRKSIITNVFFYYMNKLLDN